MVSLLFLHLDPVFAVASPFTLDKQVYQQALEPLRDQVDLLLMDCMGYSEVARQLVSELTEKPVILSTALMSKLISEII